MISGKLLLRDQTLLRVVLQILRLADELGKQGQVPLLVHLQVLEEAFVGVGKGVGLRKEGRRRGGRQKECVAYL